MFKSLQLWFRPRRVIPSDSTAELCMTLRGQSESNDQIQVLNESSATVVAVESDSELRNVTTHEESMELSSNTNKAERATVEKSDRSGLEILLDVDYYLGLSPFRISSQNQVVSCFLNKAIYLLLNAMTMLRVVMMIRYFASLLDTNVPLKDDIFFYTIIGHQLVLGTLQVRYFGLLWYQQEAIFNVIQKLKNSTWKRDLQTRLVIYAN
ncbi:unnamed protein product [Orchesella dallaii]|uniref:Uncharacterized protein n=1 Tax=Orchesella dallaii TaxID=48710 RepID=A0ABP1RXF7_9HEXA